MLAWTVPSAMDVYGTGKKTKYTYYDFDSKLPWTTTFDFDVSVTNSETTAAPLACSSKWGNCKIRYDEVYTPMLIDTVPNQVTYGTDINFMLNPNRCHYGLSADFDPFYYLKIGDTLTDWEGILDSGFRLPEWQTRPAHTVVGKNKPAKSVDPDISFTKYGKVRFKESSLHCNFAGTECWRVRVHPKIDKISAASGYTMGGQLLIVEGWGLKGLTSTSVTVDGVPCKIDTARLTDEKIYCETGSKSAPSVIGPQPGQPGITYSFVNPTDINTTPDWDNSLGNTYPKEVRLAT
jgi:hypothetical protein